jgi:hypothetical protein
MTAGVRVLVRSAVAVVVAICAGCAAVVPPINPGEEIAIVSEKIVKIDVVKMDIGKGAATGAVAGAGAGIIYGALVATVCGPFYALCLPSSIAAMGGTGAVAGGIAGGVVGQLMSISPEKRDRLIANLGNVDAQDGLAAAIETRARARWKIVPAPAPNEIVVRLEKVDLRTKREKEVALGLTATVLWKDKDYPQRVMSKTYDYVGASAPLEEWIEDQGGFVARMFGRGYAQIADELVADLEGKSR